MPGRIGFDNERYIQEQTAETLERVKRFDNKLYLEFGGKLLFDYHASRVLPGDASVTVASTPWAWQIRRRFNGWSFL
jgi:uncharacterized protein (UPF0371 family)